MDDLHSAIDSANPYQPPHPEPARPKYRTRQSRIGVASFAFAIVDAVAAIVYVGAVMAGPPVNLAVADASIQTTMIASALGVVTGIVSVFASSHRRTLGIVGLAVAGSIGIGLLAFVVISALAMGD